jgi:hypothetical protein
LLAGANLVYAQSGGASITLQPVPPKTVPPSDYPPGTTIVGQEIILGSVPARVWLEIHVTGWAPAQVTTVQVKIDALDEDRDGGGYDGASAQCDGVSSFDGGDLFPATADCNANNDCESMISGSAPPCPVAQPSNCVPRLCDYTSGGRICEPGFQDQCHSKWIGNGEVYVAAVDDCGLNYRYGIAFYPNQYATDFEPSYLGTLVLDVPSTAKGVYSIDFQEDETFLHNANPPLHNNIPIAALIPAQISVPCGRCCHGVGTDVTGCVDVVSANECAMQAPSAVFQPNQDCPDNGGPACPVCSLDEHCDDGLFCDGAEVCAGSGVCGPGMPPCEYYEVCEEDNDSCAPRIPTVNVWGMIVMTCLLLIAAKLRYRRLSAATLPQ